VIYLGADLPAEEIATAAIVVEARVVALSVLYVEDRELSEELHRGEAAD